MLKVSYLKKLADGTCELIVRKGISGAMSLNMLNGVKEEEYKARLAICATCPEFVDNKCKKCGCFTAQKARLASQSCPLGKWKISGCIQQIVHVPPPNTDASHE